MGLPRFSAYSKRGMEARTSFVAWITKFIKIRNRPAEAAPCLPLAWIPPTAASTSGHFVLRHHSRVPLTRKRRPQPSAASRDEAAIAFAESVRLTPSCCERARSTQSLHATRTHGSDGCQKGARKKSTFTPSNTKSSIADSETVIVKGKATLWFKTNPPRDTTIEVLDQGRVPILASIEQMRSALLCLSKPDKCPACEGTSLISASPVVTNTPAQSHPQEALDRIPRLRTSSKILATKIEGKTWF